jgi:MspA
MFLTRLRNAGATAVALLCVSHAAAGADPVPVPDVTQSVDTDEGWHLSAMLSKMTINSVPNMAATPLTREGFVSGKAAASISGGGSSAVNSGTVIVGLQVGCQIDLSEGGSVGASPDLGSSPSTGSSLLNDLGEYSDDDDNLSLNILPGTIKNIGLGKKALKGRTGQIMVNNAHVKVDGCGGQVSVRFFTTATIDTDVSDDSVNAYGNILTL